MNRPMTVRPAVLALLFISPLVAMASPMLSFDQYAGGAPVSGSVTVLDLDRGTWYYSDQADADFGTLPASTFKVPNLLIALEEGVIRPDSSMKWSGETYRFKGKAVDAWNRDLSIREAFTVSAIWAFIELSKRIPRSVYARKLGDMGYGNGRLDEPGPDFWNFGEFKVTPRQQLTMIAALAQDRLPFSSSSQAFVRRCMAIDGESRGLLRMKSGWAIQGGKDTGWLVGWLECAEGRFAFATRISADSSRVPTDFSELRKRISLAALDEVRAMTARAIK